jgi:hypothetical protein
LFSGETRVEEAKIMIFADRVWRRANRDLTWQKERVTYAIQ